MLHQENFDFGLGSWVIDNLSVGVGNGLWRHTSVCEAALSGHDGTPAVGYAADATCNYDTGGANSGVVTSPSIDLFGATAVQLTFQHYMGVERTNFFDQCTVEVRTDVNPAWQVVGSKNGFPGGTSLTNPNGGWEEISIDLSTFVTGGATEVQIRFHFDSIDDYSNMLPGWYVDNVFVCETN